MLELIARAFVGIEIKIHPLNVYAVYQCSTFSALLVKGEAKLGEDEHPSGAFRGSGTDLVTAVGRSSPVPPFRIPQSLSRSFKNSSTPNNFFTSAKLIACVASLSTRPVFFHTSHNSRMALAQTINDSMGQTAIL